MSSVVVQTFTIRCTTAFRRRGSTFLSFPIVVGVNSKMIKWILYGITRWRCTNAFKLKASQFNLFCCDFVISSLSLIERDSQLTFTDFSTIIWKNTVRELDVDFVTWTIIGHSQWLLRPHARHSPTFPASITSDTLRQCNVVSLCWVAWEVNWRNSCGPLRTAGLRASCETWCKLASLTPSLLWEGDEGC